MLLRANCCHKIDLCSWAFYYSWRNIYNTIQTGHGLGISIRLGSRPISTTPRLTLNRRQTKTNVNFSRSSLSSLGLAQWRNEGGCQAIAPARLKKNPFFVNVLIFTFMGATLVSRYPRTNVHFIIFIFGVFDVFDHEINFRGNFISEE